MNRGAMESSPVQQMMAAGNPNWWSSLPTTMRPPLPIIGSHHHHHHQHQQQITTSPFLSPLPPNLNIPQSSSLPFPSWHHDHHYNQDQLPESWSQYLMGGLVGEEASAIRDQVLLHHEGSSNSNNNSVHLMDHVKQESSGGNSYVYDHGHASHEDFHAVGSVKPNTNWSHLQVMPTSSPKSSCVSNFSSNMLDFSGNKADGRHPPPDRSSESNSNTGNGGTMKKARVQPSTQPTFKVRKEKLGDRITALHQLVSPFGKTDTASVLLEAIGYIRFLQSQIEALSLPYLANGTPNTRHQHSVVQGERSCLFPEDPGQLLNDNCMKRKGATHEQEYGGEEEAKNDLRSRGLCLVPVSCTIQVGSDNGADYWAPAQLGFR